jgi:type IV pilus assembly protein PilN
MSSIRINLLPHREQKRQARQRQFFTLLISLAVLGLAVIALVHGILVAQIEGQESRNKVLKTEIAKLDEQIKEIDRLREQIQAVISRKQVVETLQGNRSEAVHLLDQLVRQLPDGIYLRSVKQAGAKVTIIGYAQSNARVSTLMRNIDASPWLARPELVEIKLVPIVGGRDATQKINEFTLSFDIKRASPLDSNQLAPAPKPVPTAAPAAATVVVPAAAPAAATAVVPPSAPAPAAAPAKATPDAGKKT